MKYLGAISILITFIKMYATSMQIEAVNRSKFFPRISIAFVKIFDAKPYSAQVERLISSNTRAASKSPDQSKMLLETENLYLCVYYIMSGFEEWDPHHAIET